MRSARQCREKFRKNNTKHKTCENVEKCSKNEKRRPTDGSPKGGCPKGGGPNTETGAEGWGSKCGCPKRSCFHSPAANFVLVCTPCNIVSLSTTSVNVNTPPLTVIALFNARLVSKTRKDCSTKSSESTSAN